MFHEAEAIFVEDGRVLTDKLVEDGVVGLVVSQGHQQRTNNLPCKGRRENNHITAYIICLLGIIRCIERMRLLYKKFDLVPLAPKMQYFGR